MHRFNRTSNRDEGCGKNAKVESSGQERGRRRAYWDLTHEDLGAPEQDEDPLDTDDATSTQAPYELAASARLMRKRKLWDECETDQTLSAIWNRVESEHEETTQSQSLQQQQELFTSGRFQHKRVAGASAALC